MNIMAIGLPAAHFASKRALEECRAEATQYEQAVAAYEADGDEATLWGVLAGLGYDRREIDWHAHNRGRRLVQGYG